MECLRIWEFPLTVVFREASTDRTAQLLNSQAINLDVFDVGHRT
jgi:hypothetical protein